MHEWTDNKSKILAFMGGEVQFKLYITKISLQKCSYFSNEEIYPPNKVRYPPANLSSPGRPLRPPGSPGWAGGLRSDGIPSRPDRLWRSFPGTCRASLHVARSRNPGNGKRHALFYFFCFPWGSPEPQSFGPNFAFFREALAIL